MTYIPTRDIVAYADINFSILLISPEIQLYLGILDRKLITKAIIATNKLNIITNNLSNREFNY